MTVAPEVETFGSTKRRPLPDSAENNFTEDEVRLLRKHDNKMITDKVRDRTLRKALTKMFVNSTLKEKPVEMIRTLCYNE